MWPTCNFAASQRRPYCASVNSHSPVGIVSRQWDAVGWACVLCDRRIHSDRASRSTSSQQCTCPFYSTCAGFFLAKHHITLLQPRFGSLRLQTFPKSKIAVQVEEICECVSHTVHKLSQWRFTADWLDPQESACSQMCSKVSSYWLPSYVEATRPVLEIFKMDRYFLDSPRITIAGHIYKTGKLQSLLWCTNFPHAFFVSWPCWFAFKCMYIFCYLALFTLVPFMTAVTRICIFIALSFFLAFL
jgi:hypothetical protein